MKKFSIIVPVYNVEKYLNNCLDSIINQTYKNFEVIIVNDGSPDNSQKIIDKYANKYPDKIKSYIKKNGGLGSARNFGIERANGEYICFVDSDDFIEDNMLELLNNFVKDTNPDIVIFDNYIYTEKTGKKKLHPQGIVIKETKASKKSMLLKMPGAWIKIYKTSLIKSNKIFFVERKWYEDIAFSQKAILSAEHIEFYNKPLYNYVIRDGSIMNNNNYLRNLEIIDAFDDIIFFYKKHGFYEKYYQELEFLAVFHIYICCFPRIIRMKGNYFERRKTMKKLFDYLNNNFNGYKRNIYLKKMNSNKKIIYLLLRLKLYFLIKFIYFVKR